MLYTGQETLKKPDIFCRLPTEVLGLIFLFYIDNQPEQLPPQGRNSWRPYTLSLVCSDWRSAVFYTFGELWSNFKIDLLSNETTWKPYLLQHLHHSRDHPLEITFFTTAPCEMIFLNSKILNDLYAHAHRIQTLHFQIPPTLFSIGAALRRMQPHLTLLRSVTLPHAERPREDVLAYTPALESVTLERITSLPMLWQLPWAQLTSLTLSSCEVNPTISILSQTPQLARLSLRLDPYLLFEPKPILPVPSVQLKNLRRLQVSISNREHRRGGSSTKSTMQRTITMISNMRFQNLDTLVLDHPSQALVSAVIQCIRRSSASIVRLSIKDLWCTDKFHVDGIMLLLSAVAGTVRCLSITRNGFTQHRRTHQLSLLQQFDLQLLYLFIPDSKYNLNPFPCLDTLAISDLGFDKNCSERVLRLFSISECGIMQRGGFSIDIGFTLYSRKLRFEYEDWEAFVARLQGQLEHRSRIQARVALHV